MNILIASDSFKESLSATEICRIISDTWLSVNPEDTLISLPMSDGGEGMVDVLVSQLNGRKIVVNTLDPLGRKCQAKIGLIDTGRTAVIETAAASGLHLLSSFERNPMVTSSYGTGLLIKKALDLQVNKIIIGLGGSGTNDGGAGILTALGAELKDYEGALLNPGGSSLKNLAFLQLDTLDKRVRDVEWVCACDVNSPLLGEKGASHTFGPQKGANQEMVLLLDQALAHFSNTVQKTTGINISTIPGAGAAGGIGATILGLLNGQFKKGIDLVMDSCSFDEHVKTADLVITGEGRMDSQTLAGKVVHGIAKRAKINKVPVIAITGSLPEETATLHKKFKNVGIHTFFSISPAPQTLEKAIVSTPTQLASFVSNLASLKQIFINI